VKAGSTVVVIDNSNGEGVLVTGEAVTDPESEDPSATAVAEENDVDTDALAEDDGHGMYNQVVVNSVQALAIKMMEDEGIILAPGEAQEAQEILPKVSGILFNNKFEPDFLFWFS